MVSTQLKNITQNGILPQIGVKIKYCNKYLKPPPSNESISAYPNIPSSFISVPIFPPPHRKIQVHSCLVFPGSFSCIPNHNTWANHQVQRSGFLVVQGISSPTFGLQLVQGEGPESRQVPCSHVIFLGSVMALHKRLDIMFYFGAFPPFIRWMSSFSMCFLSLNNTWGLIHLDFFHVLFASSLHSHAILFPPKSEVPDCVGIIESFNSWAKKHAFKFDILVRINDVDGGLMKDDDVGTDDWCLILMKCWYSYWWCS